MSAPISPNPLWNISDSLVCWEGRKFFPEAVFENVDSLGCFCLNNIREARKLNFLQRGVGGIGLKVTNLRSLYFSLVYFPSGLGVSKNSLGSYSYVQIMTLQKIGV